MCGKIIESETFTESYVNSLKALDEEGKMRHSASNNPTAKDKTKELTNVTNVIKKPRTRKITEPMRDHNIFYLVNEVVWYMSGSYNIRGLPDVIEKTWETYADENGEVNSNYGAKVFHEDVGDGRTQWDVVKDLLIKDLYSRRAIFYFNLFDRDYKQLPETKDFPCTIGGQFMYDGEKLNLTIYQRSCDLNTGYGYDIPWFSILLEMMSIELGVEMGKLTHICGSLHMYKQNWYLYDGKDYHDFDEDEETIFPEMKKKDVFALIVGNHGIDTPFMNEFSKYIDEGW